MGTPTRMQPMRECCTKSISIAEAPAAAACLPACLSACLPACLPAGARLNITCTGNLTDTVQSPVAIGALDAAPSPAPTNLSWPAFVDSLRNNTAVLEVYWMLDTVTLAGADNLKTLLDVSAARSS
jgi:hypothetical protein